MPHVAVKNLTLPSAAQTVFPLTELTRTSRSKRIFPDPDPAEERSDICHAVVKYLMPQYFQKCKSIILKDELVVLLLAISHMVATAITKIMSFELEKACELDNKSRITNLKISTFPASACCA
jgi:hypothetical protein